MSQPADPSRDLLFGLLALQNGLIDQGALFAAFAAWTRDKARTLADHLVGLGTLDPDDRAAVDALANRHLKKHGGEIEKSLAVLAVPRSTRESLVQAGGPDVEATLGHVGSANPPTRDDDDNNDPDRTGSISVGSATSEGQRFRIVRPHARGGLGAVFVALDSELDREVALKQILDDRADDPTSQIRFLLEAQITGGLEHPGIVPVYGLGAYSDGRPYYAMRFIRGDSLKEAIEGFHKASKAGTGLRDLELRKLLRRFTDVCNAIDYAHSRGVVHRDIKPANIIVGKYGETLVVDWGLAKPMGHVEAGTESGERLLTPSSSSGSAETLPGSAMGTPAYMSPEQAEGQLDRLGPRSDVYSLGATLYCLLTGQPPFTGEVVDVIRAVQKGEFRLPRQLHSNIDTALEAICLKALAHKPDDRYASSRALADDLDRWMADEPVTAWREPFSRRARRWALRNRTAVTAVSVALAALVAGLVAVTAVQARANSELRAANAEVKRVNADLADEKARVQERYNLAVDAIKTFHTGVSEDFLLTQEQFKAVRDPLLKSASDFYGKLGALLGKESDLASRRALWQANYEVAVLTSKVGKPEDALAAHRQVLAARVALAAETPADQEIEAEVGRSLMAIAHLLETTGQTKEAEETYRKAETLLVKLAQAIPNGAASRAVLANCRSWLGWLLHTTGRNDDALAVFRLARADQEALAAEPEATAERRRDLAATINRVAILLAATGKSSEAEVESREALAIQQKLADDNPAVADFHIRLSHGHFNLGILLTDTGKPAEAEAEYRKALAVYGKLVDENPAVTDFRNNLAKSYDGLGILLTNTGKSSEAEAEYRKALAIYGKLVNDNPAVTEFRDNLARNHISLGNLLSSAGKSSEAEAEYRKSLAILQKLADDNPAVTRYQRSLAISLLRIGWQLAQAGEMAEAIGYYEREGAIRQKLARASSPTPDDTSSLANCQTNMADVLRRSGRLDEALTACERAATLREPLVAAHPEIPRYRLDLGETYMRLGQVRRDLENLAGASTAWKRACAHLDVSKVVDGEQTFFRACCHAGPAGLAGRPGSGISLAERPHQADEAMAVLHQAVATGHRNPNAYRTESALDPLRNRDDFKLLMMDLVMPARPFAQ